MIISRADTAILAGTNEMRVFQEEIFGPVTGVTTFKDEEEAIAIANDTVYGLGAGVWTRDAHQAYQVPRAIEAGRVWVNCYHAYPAHAPFGGYKQSGFGRETHKMMLNHYVRQSVSILSSHPSPIPAALLACSLLPSLPAHPEVARHRAPQRQTKNMLISLDKNKLGFF